MAKRKVAPARKGAAPQVAKKITITIPKKPIPVVKTSELHSFPSPVSMQTIFTWCDSYIRKNPLADGTELRIAAHGSYYEKKSIKIKLVTTSEKNPAYLKKLEEYEKALLATQMAINQELKNLM